MTNHHTTTYAVEQAAALDGGRSATPLLIRIFYARPPYEPQALGRVQDHNNRYVVVFENTSSHYLFRDREADVIREMVAFYDLGSKKRGASGWRAIRRWLSGTNCRLAKTCLTSRCTRRPRCQERLRLKPRLLRRASPKPWA